MFAGLNSSHVLLAAMHTSRALSFSFSLLSPCLSYALIPNLRTHISLSIKKEMQQLVIFSLQLPQSFVNLNLFKHSTVACVCPEEVQFEKI